MRYHSSLVKLSALFIIICCSFGCSSKAKEISITALPLIRSPEIRTPATVATSRDQLWEITKTCVANFLAHGSPDPCLVVDLKQGQDQGQDQTQDQTQDQGQNQGFVILKDRLGASHFLLIPTRKILGIEDPILISKEMTNFWSKAFEHLSYVPKSLNKQIPLDHLIIGINSTFARSQDQLHLHLDCLAPEVLQWLQTNGKNLAPNGGEAAVFKRAKFRVWKIKSHEFINPFLELAEDAGSTGFDIKKHALALVTSKDASGQFEFFVFDSMSAPEGSPYSGGSADLLMDRQCSIGLAN